MIPPRKINARIPLVCFFTKIVNQWC
jgi:hypothetical protein